VVFLSAAGYALAKGEAARFAVRGQTGMKGVGAPLTPRRTADVPHTGVRNELVPWALGTWDRFGTLKCTLK
jgi:hypothetical protein